MIVFLGICFILLSLCLTDVKVNLGSKFISGAYIIGMILLDLAILAAMVGLWMMENGKL